MSLSTASGPVANATSPGPVSRTVWGLGVRLTHWGVALLVLYTLWGESGAEHRTAGYAIVILVLARLLAGCCVPPGHPARVAVPHVADVKHHACQLRSGRVLSGAGHNPLGAAMALLLWIVLLLLALSGWVSRWDMFWGEESVESIHTALSYLLQGCLVLHIAGVVVSSRAERQNLALSMITGRKRVD